MRKICFIMFVLTCIMAYSQNCGELQNAIYAFRSEKGAVYSFIITPEDAVRINPNLDAKAYKEAVFDYMGVTSMTVLQLKNCDAVVKKRFNDFFADREFCGFELLMDDEEGTKIFKNVNEDVTTLLIIALSDTDPELNIIVGGKDLPDKFFANSCSM